MGDDDMEDTGTGAGTDDGSKSEADWYDHAAELHECGGVPERRAEVVALIVRGYTHNEVAEILDLNHRATVGQHLAHYRNADLPNAKWLVEHGPEI